MRPVVVAPRACRDVEVAARWYDRQRDGLGDDFVDAVAAAIALLADGPERFPVMHQDLRRSPVDRFPYALTFPWLAAPCASSPARTTGATPAAGTGGADLPQVLIQLRPWPRRTRST